VITFNVLEISSDRLVKIPIVDDVEVAELSFRLKHSNGAFLFVKECIEKTVDELYERLNSYSK